MASPLRAKSTKPVLVWTAKRRSGVNFSGCFPIHDGLIIDRRPDVRALAEFIFHWLTGEAHFERTSSQRYRFSASADPALRSWRWTDKLRGWLGISRMHSTEPFKIIDAQAVDYDLAASNSRRNGEGFEPKTAFWPSRSSHQQSISGRWRVVIGRRDGRPHGWRDCQRRHRRYHGSKSSAELMSQQAEAHDRVEWLRQAVEAVNQEVY